MKNRSIDEICGSSIKRCVSALALVSPGHLESSTRTENKIHIHAQSPKSHSYHTSTTLPHRLAYLRPCPAHPQTKPPYPTNEELPHKPVECTPAGD